MILFVTLIASLCLAKPSGSKDISSDLLSKSCERGLGKCSSVTSHCDSKRGRDHARCICDAGPQLIKCASSVSGCSPNEKKEIVELLSISSDMMCKAAEGRLNNARGRQDTDGVNSLPKGRKPVFEDDETIDFDTFGEKDDFDFLKEFDDRNSTDSISSTDSTNSTTSGAFDLSKVAFFSSMLFMIAL